MKRLIPFIGLLALMGGCGNDAASYLSAHGTSNLQLREYETKELAFRYVDKDGYPIVGGAVRLSTQGNMNNAVLETVVARADQQGVARTTIRAGFAANFTVVAEADDAMPVQVPVNVAQANGGTLTVTVFARAAASATQAQVTLVNNISCMTFDPRMPPAAASNIANGTQSAAVSTTGAAVSFVGLVPGQQYAVIAVATANGQTVAKGCADNLTITQQEVDQRIARQASLYLEDFTTSDWSGNALLVETSFNYPLHLVRVANLLKEMSDSPADPLDFIIDRALATGDYWTTLLGTIVKDQLVQYVQSQSPQSQLTRAKLQGVYQALANVSDVKLYTTLKIEDETKESQGQLTGVHTFRYFAANVGGLQQKYYLRPGVNLFGDASQMITETEARLRVEDAARLRIDPHTLTLPIADAIIGTLLVDTFAEYKLEAVFTSLVDCSGVGELVAQYYDDWRGGASSVEKTAIKSGMNTACKKILSNMAVKLYDDVRADITDFGLGNDVTLEGSTNVGMLADGRTIGQMTNGQWVGVGSFSASRY